MKPTEILVNEHKKIEQVLDCLEKAVEKARRDSSIEKDLIRDSLEFFRNFADGTHHKKEEKLLFPLLVERGIPKENGPVGVMLYEHEQGRFHLKGVSEALEEYDRDPERAVSKFIDHAEAYVSLLRDHIQKENHCLFPMGDQVFSEQDQEHLKEGFTRFDRERESGKTPQELIRLADEIAEKSGVEVVSVPLATS